MEVERLMNGCHSSNLSLSHWSAKKADCPYSLLISSSVPGEVLKRASPTRPYHLLRRECGESPGQLHHSVVFLSDITKTQLPATRGDKSWDSHWGSHYPPSWTSFRHTVSHHHEVHPSMSHTDLSTLLYQAGGSPAAGNTLQGSTTALYLKLPQPWTHWATHRNPHTSTQHRTAETTWLSSITWLGTLKNSGQCTWLTVHLVITLDEHRHTMGEVSMTFMHCITNKHTAINFYNINSPLNICRSKVNK